METVDQIAIRSQHEVPYTPTLICAESRLKPYFDSSIFMKEANFQYFEGANSFFYYSWGKSHTVYGCTGLVLYTSTYSYFADRPTKQRLSYLIPVTDISPTTYNLMI